MSDKHSHWHIAGLGAIGALCNATAIRAGLMCQPIVRANSQSYCTSFIDIDGFESPLTPGLPLRQIDRIDNLVVPLKSYDVLPFLEQALSKLSAKANVVLCHNGMGTLEPAKALLPSSVNLYFCTSSHGVFKTNRQATHAGLGESIWQLVARGSDRVLEQEDMEKLFPNAQPSSDLARLLWQKLIINCAINPLTAIHKVKNGELAAAEFESEIRAIVTEACAVARASGVNIGLQEMLNTVYQVIDKTAKNTSSMLQDSAAGKTTEIDYITGFLLEQARKQQIVTPVNQAVFQRLARQR